MSHPRPWGCNRPAWLEFSAHGSSISHCCECCNACTCILTGAVGQNAGSSPLVTSAVPNDSRSLQKALHCMDAYRCDHARLHGQTQFEDMHQWMLLGTGCLPTIISQTQQPSRVTYAQSMPCPLSYTVDSTSCSSPHSDLLNRW